MARLIYQHPTDNKAGSASSVTPSTEDAGYPIENIYDLNPAKPFRMTAASGNIVWEFASAQQLEVVSLIHTNLDAGYELRIQGNAANAWGAPTLNEVIEVPGPDEDDFAPNPWIDLSGLASRSFQYWRLLFVDTNSANIAIGDVWLGETKRSLTHNYSWGYQITEERKVVEHQTDYGVTSLYDLGARLRSLSGEVRTSDAGLANLRAWWRACHGRALPTLIVPDPDVNDAWLARWGTPERADRPEFRNNNVVPVSWTELSRGLVL